MDEIGLLLCVGSELSCGSGLSGRRLDRGFLGSGRSRLCRLGLRLIVVLLRLLMLPLLLGSLLVGVLNQRSRLFGMSLCSNGSEVVLVELSQLVV